MNSEEVFPACEESAIVAVEGKLRSFQRKLTKVGKILTVGEKREEEENRLGKMSLHWHFTIAFLPPIWAVLSPYIGVTTGAVAFNMCGLICCSRQ